MSYEAVDCVDAGTDYCPCYLADTNNCIICSQLQGKVFCDCINWKGVCIYQEYKWNGSKPKEPRENINAKVIKNELIDEKQLFLKIKVTKTMARELNQPGSYIFLRDSNCPDFFDTPMSIMFSDETNETIDILVQIKGTKTKNLTNNTNFTMRAPYFNGIIGLKNIKAISNKNCLIVARGIAQAPAVLVAKKLKYSGNNTTVLLDRGNLNIKLPKKYFEELGCNIIDINLIENRNFTDNAGSVISNIIAEHDIKLIFSAGSDLVHKSIIGIKNNHSGEILFSCTNNANICCGEGVCGSCSKRLKDGRRIKACKAQIDPVDILGGI